jgi:hypothetical protein
MGQGARSRIAFDALASNGGLPTTAGMLAARAWLQSRQLSPPSLVRWNATILLAPFDHEPAPEVDESRDTRFRIEIYSEEWGFFFCHHGRASWIRITDVPFVHGRDDHQLLALAPALRDIGVLMRKLEKQHVLQFKREHALIRTNLPNSETAIRSWVQGL